MSITHIRWTMLLCMSAFSASLFAQNLPVSFTDRTDLLPTSNHCGVCMAVVDMNGDGKDDIVRYNQGRELNIEYQNADGSFQRTVVGNIANSSQWITAVADVDRNGLNDILVGGIYDNICLLYTSPSPRDRG